jgi:predicted protein tyrosine phosphatase
MYQGADKKVLFVCSAGILRSATAARLYARKYNTRCCGTAPYALIRLSDNLVAWADEIVFVNDENYQAARCMYDFKSINGEKKVVVLDIPDDYAHMHPELIKHFKEQYEDF